MLGVSFDISRNRIDFPRGYGNQGYDISEAFSKEIRDLVELQNRNKANDALNCFGFIMNVTGMGSPYDTKKTAKDYEKDRGIKFFPWIAGSLENESMDYFYAAISSGKANLFDLPVRTFDEANSDPKIKRGDVIIFYRNVVDKENRTVFRSHKDEWEKKVHFTIFTGVVNNSGKRIFLQKFDYGKNIGFSDLYHHQQWYSPEKFRLQRLVPPKQAIGKPCK